jgi:steroid 5-alpha reductase family enzyme
MHFVLMAAGAGGLLSAVMAFEWRVQQHAGNSGWINIFWTFGVGKVAVSFALFLLG